MLPLALSIRLVHSEADATQQNELQEPAVPTAFMINCLQLIELASEGGL